MPEQRVRVYLLKPNDRPNLKLQWLEPHTGIRRSKMLKTSDPDEAEVMRADLECQINTGQYARAERMNWADFRILFFEEYAAGMRMHTAEKFGTVLDVFEQLMKPKQVQAINERTISLFVAALRKRKNKKGEVGLAPITIRNYMIALKTVLKWVAQQNFLAAVPEFPKVKVVKKKPQPIATADFEKLLARAPDDAWRGFLLCGWWAGLRLSEAYQLRRKPNESFPWLDLPNDRIVLPGNFVKGGQDQWVPLHKTLKEALEKVPDTGDLLFPFKSHKGGGPLTNPGLSQRVILMSKQAGVKLGMHKLRKGFGCRVAARLGKGNAPILHTMMRHTSMQITMDYYASVDDVLQEAINQL